MNTAFTMNFDNDNREVSQNFQNEFVPSPKTDSGETKVV